jgi:hypothetical protein
MEETKGKILLSGFGLEEAERAICDNIIKSHISKIEERSKFDYLKLRLRKSQRGKNCLHEIEGTLKVKGGIFTSKTEDFNLFSALAEIMEKLLNELNHKIRTSRQNK